MNILLLMADQFNARCLGAESHADARTPHLDGLAAGGTRFSRAYVQNPICTPSRMSWLSGLYPHNHGYYGLWGPNAPWLPHAFSVTREAGWRTGAMGKLHCPIGWLEPYLDVGCEAYGLPAAGRASDYAAYLEERGLLHLRDDHKLPEWAALDGQGQGLDARSSQLPYEHSVDAWTAREAMSFLRAHAARGGVSPFLLYASFPRPHQVWTPAQEFWDLYDEETLTLPPNAGNTLADRPPHVHEQLRQRDDPWQWVFEPRTWERGFRRALHGYLACVSQVDHAVGEVLAALDELGLRDETLVVFGADHGGFAGDHGIVEKAPGVGFEAVCRIPFIWSLPGRPDLVHPGHVPDALVESVDFLPTALALAGVASPPQCDGHDLSALLRADSVTVREAAFTENVWSRRVRTDRWSYVHYLPQMLPDATSSGELGELYDMRADPWEQHNLYGKPEHAETVAALQRHLLDWFTSTQHPITALGLSAAGGSARSDGRIAPRQIAGHVNAGRLRKYL